MTRIIEIESQTKFRAWWLKPEECFAVDTAHGVFKIRGQDGIEAILAMIPAIDSGLFAELRVITAGALRFMETANEVITIVPAGAPVYRLFSSGEEVLSTSDFLELLYRLKGNAAK